MFEVLVLTEANTQEMLIPSNHCFLLNNIIILVQVEMPLLLD